MTEYIKREDVMERVGRWQLNTRETIAEMIMSVPSADVVERKKGKWQITDAYPHNVYCSECHKKFAQTHWAVWGDGSLPRNFCPNCGADMRDDDIPMEYFESGGI